MYYLRTKPAVNAIQYTVEKSVTESQDDHLMVVDGESVCESCQG
jgi:hypothetical protein